MVCGEGVPGKAPNLLLVPNAGGAQLSGAVIRGERVCVGTAAGGGPTPRVAF